MTRNEAINFLLENPYKLGHLLGFTKLTKLHNKWIKDMVRSEKDKTLQAHRGSYKTTCVSIALAILIVLRPSAKIAFIRKTGSDVKAIIRQVKKILKSDQMRHFVRIIYGSELILLKETDTEITTNLCNDTKGDSQLIGFGIGGSVTGKHYDIIFTDDIVNLEDRKSRAAREETKLFYMELQNLKNRGGRIYNTGTPWHKEDCFTLMPKAIIYDCYHTGLIDSDELKTIRSKMTASLFAANYELRHIASDDVIFTNPQTGYEQSLAMQGISHYDAAYYGEDFTALTIINKHDGYYYIYGRLWRKHIDDCESDIIKLHKAFNAGKMYTELNADKGASAKSMKKNSDLRVVTYSETMNKFIKISSYLKQEWEKVRFVVGTDEEYINQICDYNEDAEHDDAPDSCTCAVMRMMKKKERTEEELAYYSQFL